MFPVEVPSLRQRRDDICVLTQYFVHRYSAAAGKSIRSIEKRTLQLLQAYDWPGNIRELQNVLERAVILCDGGTLSIEESWLTKEPCFIEENSSADLPQTLVNRERAIIEAALAETHGRIFGPAGAAIKLGVPRSTLESRIKVLNINKYRFKAAQRRCN